MSDEVMIGAKRFGEFYALGDDLSAVKHINGTSLTIPGQARDLGALLAASKFSGGMIPIHGHPKYDEDLAHGLARIQADAMDEEQLSSLAINAAAAAKKKEDEGSTPPPPADVEDDGVK